MGDDAVLTELAGVAEAPTESVHAWALDYDEYESAARRFAPRRVTAAALAGCLVLMAVAGVVALLGVRGVWHIAPAPIPVAAPAPATTTPQAAAPTVVRAQPLPPPTVTVTAQAPPTTVQAPPPAGITVEQVAAYDQQFVANLQARGWAVWDSLAITQQAHRVCAALERGASPQSVVQQLIGPTTPLADAQQFVTTATLTYPNCP